MANNYESPLTLFLNKYKADNPDTEAGQRAGRFRLWDRNLDFEAQSDYRAARTQMSPYVYYDNLSREGPEGDHTKYPPTRWFDTGWLA